MVEYDYIDWGDHDDPENPGETRDAVKHIARHAVTPGEFMEVIDSPSSTVTISRSSGRPAVIGRTAVGRRLFAVFQLDSEGGVTVLSPWTAFDY